MVLFEALIEDPIRFFSRQRGTWPVIQIVVPATVFAFCGNPWKEWATHYSLFPYKVVMQTENHGLWWMVFTFEFKVCGMTGTVHQQDMLLARFVVWFCSENMIPPGRTIKHPAPRDQEFHINRHVTPHQQLMADLSCKPFCYSRMYVLCLPSAYPPGVCRWSTPYLMATTYVVFSTCKMYLSS